jgi:hypothetical protein
METVDEILRLRAEGNNLSEIARLTGTHRQTVKKVVRKFDSEGGAKVSSSDGKPPDPKEYNRVVDSTDLDGSVELIRMDRPASPQELQALADLDPRKWRPKHVRINTWQGSAKVKYKVGAMETEKLEKIPLYQSRVTFERLVTEPVERAIEEYIRENVTPLEPDRSIAAQKRVLKDPHIVVAGWWDTHLGMYAWNKEVGADFDLDIAMRRIKNSVDDLVEELKKYQIQEVIMPVGNDLLHYDSVKKTTTYGDHWLDCDTRYSRVYLGALQSLTYMVDSFLLHLCDKVKVVYVPGNHDYTSGFTLAVALDQRYLNDPRVETELGMNPRKYVKHGGTVIGFDHGKDVKAAQYPIVLACEAKELWADSTWREMQIGHTHQRREAWYKGTTPTNGVLVRTNPSLSGTDAWHHGKGFLGEPIKSVEAWRYDTTGYRGSHVALARDE